MKRRDSLKTIALGTVGSGLALDSFKKQENKKEDLPIIQDSHDYGRTPKEIKRDKELKQETFFTEHEMATLAILCDYIIPKDAISGSSSEAGVPEFIEFMAKDQPYHQTPLRGGIMWLDHEANELENKTFADCSQSGQKALLDRVAYPDKAVPSDQPGVRFFNHLKNLTATGFFTSQMGIKDLGYQGNVPNVWEGVPEDELKKFGFSYDDDPWKDQYVTTEARNSVIEWDDEANIIK